jgi:hypothetical protein
MKVVCKENRAINLDLKEVTSIFSQEAYFSVVKGKEYIVMGIMVYKDSNCIYYLIDDYDLPEWQPYPLFDISDSELSTDWHVSILNKAESAGNIFYLSGFSELCNNEDYQDALEEREKWALDIYFKRKYAAQEWYFTK